MRHDNVRTVFMPNIVWETLTHFWIEFWWWEMDMEEKWLRFELYSSFISHSVINQNEVLNLVYSQHFSRVHFPRWRFDSNLLLLFKLFRTNSSDFVWSIFRLHGNWTESLASQTHWMRRQASVADCNQFNDGKCMRSSMVSAISFESSRFQAKRINMPAIEFISYHNLLPTPLQMHNKVIRCPLWFQKGVTTIEWKRCRTFSVANWRPNMNLRVYTFIGATGTIVDRSICLMVFGIQWNCIWFIGIDCTTVWRRRWNIMMAFVLWHSSIS